MLSVDDVALRRGHRYATVLIDAVTHRRIDVLPDRKAATLAAWLREHPGAEVVCRDGSAAYAEAIRQGAPEAVQVSDRWHLWHGLGEAVEKTVIAHSSCWRTAAPARPGRAIDERTRARHAAVHDLLDQGVGLLECARRLGWALNTVKRYARAATAEQLQRPPRYGRTLVDPYRDHLRRRLAAEPDVAVTRLLAEIRELGYTGSANLLVRYLNQGRADDRTAITATATAGRMDHDRPADLPEHERETPRRAAGRLSAPRLHVPASPPATTPVASGRRGQFRTCYPDCKRPGKRPGLCALLNGPQPSIVPFREQTGSPSEAVTMAR